MIQFFKKTLIPQRVFQRGFLEAKGLFKKECIHGLFELLLQNK
jgi:hypothetical protein